MDVENPSGSAEARDNPLKQTLLHDLFDSRKEQVVAKASLQERTADGM